PPPRVRRAAWLPESAPPPPSRSHTSFAPGGLPPCPARSPIPRCPQQPHSLLRLHSPPRTPKPPSRPPPSTRQKPRTGPTRTPAPPTPIGALTCRFAASPRASSARRTLTRRPTPCASATPVPAPPGGPR